MGAGSSDKHMLHLELAREVTRGTTRLRRRLHAAAIIQVISSRDTLLFQTFQALLELGCLGNACDRTRMMQGGRRGAFLAALVTVPGPPLAVS